MISYKLISWTLLGVAALCAAGMLVSPAWAQAHDEAAAPSEAEVAPPADPNIMGNAVRTTGLAIGAAIAIAAAGLATARAQAAVGAGGTGALAEKPELFGNILILFAIPETIIILGFVIAILLVLAI